MRDEAVTDLTRGVYRRLYSGFITGQRINKLSLQAEAWFWRILATVDDFGNGHADPDLCRAATVGKRKIAAKQVSEWLRQMKDVGLIEFYTVKGEPFLHVVDFELTQPAGKNGKRLKKFRGPDESEGFQVNPDSSSASHSDTHSHTEDDTDTYTEARAPVDVVFEFYKTHMAHPKTVLTAERRKLITRRLGDGYSPDDLCAAIAGCKASAFHQGDNDRGAKYDSLELILRDAKHIEDFIAKSQAGTNGNGHKPKTASERNVANLRDSLAVFSQQRGPDNSQEPSGLLAAGPDAGGERVDGRGMV